MTSEKLKKEISLIESLVIQSKIVLAIKIALKEQRKTLFLITRLPMHILVADKIKDVIEELEYNLIQTEKNISRILSKFISDKNIMIPEKFYLSGSDMKSGYTSLQKVISINPFIKKTVYLLLSNVTKDILSYKEGSILSNEELHLIINNISSVLGNMESIYKITLNSKCSIVEPH